ncbi:MAG: DUF1688 family protein [Bdellovibrionales bacterium]|nr:DUF1688 family protein [Bdellovibrionales bacterium]
MNKLDHYLSPAFVREGAELVFASTLRGETKFLYDESKFKPTVDFVLDVIRENYPDLDIPFHSRWGHFRAGGTDRLKWLRGRHAGADPLEMARIQFDLVIPSVLLDAGAGPDWKYFETETQKNYSRSEGLGVASFHLLHSGKLSATSKGLKNITDTELASAFQVSPENPLVGVQGRTGLLNQLGKVLENATFFADQRPGSLVDYLIKTQGRVIPAREVLRAVLLALGPIWPGRVEYEGVNLGDVWNHQSFGLIGFHKLSQWMTYSLLEPLMEAGLTITGVQELTGLAEYRNGGLFLDSELIRFKDPAQADEPHSPSTDLILEWRALTVALLDRVGVEVQKSLGRTPDEFPLAKVLEGGTWWAGRKIAKLKRNSSEPPIRIRSDGTVF